MKARWEKDGLSWFKLVDVERNRVLGLVRVSNGLFSAVIDGYANSDSAKLAVERAVGAEVGE